MCTPTRVGAMLDCWLTTRQHAFREGITARLRKPGRKNGSAVAGSAEHGLDRSRGDIFIDANAENHAAVTRAAFEIGDCLQIRAPFQSMFMLVEHLQHDTAAFFQC